MRVRTSPKGVLSQASRVALWISVSVAWLADRLVQSTTLVDNRWMGCCEFLANSYDPTTRKPPVFVGVFF